MSALYSRELLRLGTNLADHPPLDPADGEATRRSSVCGSEVSATVRLTDERIAALGLDTRACALGQASAAVFAGSVIGQTAESVSTARAHLADWLAGERDDAPFGYDPLAPARAHAARHPSMLLAYDATLAAIEAAG